MILKVQNNRDPSRLNSSTPLRFPPSPTKRCVRSSGYDEDNCAQQLVRIAAGQYGLCWPDDVYRSLAVYTGGMGIGEICGALLGAAAVFGLLCDEKTARRLSLLLFQQCQAEFGSLSCPRLRAQFSSCDDLILDIFHKMDRLLRQEGLFYHR